MAAEPVRDPDAERIWAAPDSMLVDAGAGGELLVAKVRMALVALVTIIPIYNLTVTPYFVETWVGLASSLGAMIFAVTVWVVVRRGFYRPWLGFLTSAVDVTFVTVTLATFLYLDTPHVAVNSRIMYSVYFFSIGASSLRYDTRICIVTGALAVVQYAMILVLAGLFWDLNDLRYAPFMYGMVELGRPGGAPHPARGVGCAEHRRGVQRAQAPADVGPRPADRAPQPGVLRGAAAGGGEPGAAPRPPDGGGGARPRPLQELQ